MAEGAHKYVRRTFVPGVQSRGLILNTRGRLRNETTNGKVQSSEPWIISLLLQNQRSGGVHDRKNIKNTRKNKEVSVSLAVHLPLSKLKLAYSRPPCHPVVPQSSIPVHSFPPLFSHRSHPIPLQVVVVIHKKKRTNRKQYAKYHFP